MKVDNDSFGILHFDMPTPYNYPIDSVEGKINRK